MKTIIYVILIILILISGALGISYLSSGSPLKITNNVIIERSPDSVFNYAADMRNELKWNPDIQFMAKITEGPVGKGTHFKAKWHLSDTLDVEIKHFDPPYYLVFVNGGPIEVELEIRLTSSDNKTNLESNFVATPHGFLRAIFPFLKRKLENQEKENMINLKNALEGVEEN